MEQQLATLNMTEALEPLEYLKQFDLTATFDIMVGKAPSSQRFTVYTEVLTSRSQFLKAARKPEWLTDPTKPTDLEDEDPKVFARYLNCVYFGAEAFKTTHEYQNPSWDYISDDVEPPDAFKCSETEHAAGIKQKLAKHEKYITRYNETHRNIIEVYLLADKLQDLETANLAADTLFSLDERTQVHVSPENADLVYESTGHGDPMRKLIRDQLTYFTDSAHYMRLHVLDWHPELLRDVAVEHTRLVDYGGIPRDFEPFHGHTCRYHLHNEEFPRCANDFEPAPMRSSGSSGANSDLDGLSVVDGH